MFYRPTGTGYEIVTPGLLYLPMSVVQRQSLKEVRNVGIDLDWQMKMPLSALGK